MLLASKSLEKALEWSLIREALASRTRSPLGNQLAFRHQPFSIPTQSTRLRERVAEGKILISKSPVHGYVADVIDIREVLERASRDGVLEPGELWACGHFMSTVGLVGSELRQRKTEAPLWSQEFSTAPDTPALCEQIARSVSSDGAILDTASTLLARLRQERLARRSEFERLLEHRLKDWNSKGLLQDSFYDVVDGRYVVPVKAEQQSKLDGILFGKSNTGQSVFIEPVELTGPNNALKEIDLSIRSEEYRILKSLSQQVATVADIYDPWIEVIAELDLALAAARLAVDWDLSEPQVADGDLELRNLFHPGLKVQRIEPVLNTVRISKGGRALLISGPNTGGKTVLLKAVALACSMARAGLFIPAEKGSKVPHYKDAIALIGDEQNLAAGLSSFSAQIKDLQTITKEPGLSPALIVVDEILSSTDPEEASALAQAFIEEFTESGHHVLVTSHFSELSLRCTQNPKITVAAMEFEGGRPTYRLLENQMGSSHALEIASSLGVPKRILERARSFVSTAKQDYEKAVSEARERGRELETQYREAHLALGREKEDLKREFKEKLDAFVAAAEQRLADTIAALNQRIVSSIRQGIGSKTKLEARIKSSVHEALSEIEREALTLQEEPEKAEVEPIAAGCLVRVRSMKTAQGKVLELKEDGPLKTALVQVGNFRLERPLEDLEVMALNEKPSQKPGRRSAAFFTDATPLESTRIDLRGLRYDEALARVEQYLDQAFRSGAPSVTVITGHGTGAIKKGVKELLGALPYVVEFKPERGNDDGALVVQFDQ
ncbi:MAG: Smr/MutS family protein [Bdellovibrionota bacterium]